MTDNTNQPTSTTNLVHYGSAELPWSLGLEGDVHWVTGSATVERLAAVFRASGWQATAEGDEITAPHSAPSAGPAPWYLYRLPLRKAVGVASAEPGGATRWDFA